MSKLFLAIITTTLLLTANFSFAKVPENITMAKQAAIRYHDSGEYNYDVSRAIQFGKEYLAKKIAANKIAKHKKKLAITLDIDDTAITNYNLLKKQDFCSN